MLFTIWCLLSLVMAIAAVSIPPGSRPISLFLPGPDESNISNPPMAPLPNPYPIPNTPYSIFFYPPEEWLSFADTKQCLTFSRTRYLFKIRQGQGNDPLEPHEYDLKSTVFGIAPLPAQGPFGLTWNDAPPIVDAFLRKMTAEGYRKRLARIYVTNWGQTVGTALVQPNKGNGGGQKGSLAKT
ncbi:MAG: hypothetical protein LQ346_005925 [Caloplaca aetnensis]|nr:MAG: hypothetical protein LQ346_005925 [Caloplaca aetnensis]